MDNATDDNATHALCKLPTQGYKHTLIAFPPRQSLQRIASI